ncbi:MAG: radical SAM protein [Thermoplasmata archaeon]|nr:radical SAM protein [Thermoplasmata archaeon]
MKKKFYYNGRTGIARTEGFEHKLLAKYSVNIGNICEFGCSFCYVPSITNKQKTVKSILDKGYKIEEFSSYRYKVNVLSTVANDLRNIKKNDYGTVIFCTTCDPCATLEHADISIATIKLIMQRSNLQIRVLSKSVLIKNIAESLKTFNKRITYGLSTGTSLEEVSKAIEQNASPIRKRVEVLRWLQDNNFRTYGMICPVIPSEVDRVKELLNQIRPELCEDVWVEAVNVRGKSLVNTYEKLMNAGLENHALELKRVMENKDNWREYCKKLFLNFQNEMRKRNQLKKLHFLQYVSPEDKEFFNKQEGAVCL